MPIDRRTALRLAGVGVGTALAGCLDLGDGSDGDGTPTGTPTGSPSDDPTDTPGDPGADPDATLTDHETTPLALRSSAPSWYRGDDAAVGHAVVVDSRSRERAAIGRYDLPEERAAAVRAFFDDVDYASDRVVLVESAGPDGCHDELAFDDEVRVEDGRLRAAAAVVDDSGAQTGCTEALVYPSALLRVTFDGEPLDAVSVEVTDGWAETATVTASADDPLHAPDPDELPGYVRPDAEPDPVASLSCEGEDVTRHDQWFDEADVQWGDLEADGDGGSGGSDDGTADLSLRVDALEYAHGDTATFTLTNVAGQAVHTGNRHKYAFQVYTEDGWQDVRVKDDGSHFEYTDEAIEHEPGGGFEWSVELTERGVVEGTYHDDARVCPDLQPGRYRFAYFGVVGEGAVAVAFELTE